MQTTNQGYNVGVKEYKAEDGLLKLTLPPQSATVFTAEKLKDIRVMAVPQEDRGFPEPEEEDY